MYLKKKIPNANDILFYQLHFSSLQLINYNGYYVLDDFGGLAKSAAAYCSCTAFGPISPELIWPIFSGALKFV